MRKLTISEDTSSNIIRIIFEKERKFTLENSTADILLLVNTSENKYIIKISKWLFLNKSFKFKLIDSNGHSIIFYYDIDKKSLNINYQNNNSTLIKTQITKNVDYGVGEESIIKITIKDVINLLKTENELYINCTRWILNENDEETIEFYYNRLKVFEQLNDRVKETMSLLKHIMDYFPLCSTSVINKIINNLRNIKYLEIEQFIIILEEIDKKEVIFESV